MTNQSIDNIRAICRVFLDNNRDAILLFPDQEERDNCVNSWQPNGGHACASRDLSRYTRQATMEELASIKRLYDTIYGCNLVIMRRMPARRF